MSDSGASFSIPSININLKFEDSYQDENDSSSFKLLTSSPEDLTADKKKNDNKGLNFIPFNNFIDNSPFLQYKKDERATSNLVTNEKKLLVERLFKENKCMGDDSFNNFKQKLLNKNTDGTITTTRSTDNTNNKENNIKFSPPPSPMNIENCFSNPRSRLVPRSNHMLRTTSTPYQPSPCSRFKTSGKLDGSRLNADNPKRILFKNKNKLFLDSDNINNKMCNNTNNSMSKNTKDIESNNVIGDINKSSDEEEINKEGEKDFSEMETSQQNNFDEIDFDNNHYNKNKNDYLQPIYLNKLNNNNHDNNVSMMSWKEGDSLLLGDFSKKFQLPLHPSKHPDLKALSYDTLGDLLQGKHGDLIEKCFIVDCRYPFEYDGGHIMGAININNHKDLLKFFFSPSDPISKDAIIIFHCEFSSERAPKMMRFLRNHDRTLNEHRYPLLQYPEVYLLEGGYSLFFRYHPNLCQPINYVPMLQPEFLDQLKTSQTKSRSIEEQMNKLSLLKRSGLFILN